MPRPPVLFRPKTNTHLLPGDWWAVPMRDGRFAAGRVLARQAFGETDRVGVTVGLCDWVGEQPPTEKDIAWRPLLAWALTRVDAIAKTGGSVLGNRPLAADALAAPDLTYGVGEAFTVWGWRTIVTHAERHFLEDK